MRKLFLIFSLTGILGCAEEKKKIPAGLLPPAKLTSILADIHIAEARVENLNISPDSSKVVFNRLQLEVFKKHGVSKKGFDKTYDYYLNNLNDLDKIYERLVDTLSMREVKMTSSGKKTVQKKTVQKQPEQDSVLPDTTKKTDKAALKKAKRNYLI